MRQCPICGTPCSDDAQKCIRCGRALSAAPAALDTEGDFLDMSDLTQMLAQSAAPADINRRPESENGRQEALNNAAQSAPAAQAETPAQSAAQPAAAAQPGAAAAPQAAEQNSADLAQTTPLTATVSLAPQADLTATESLTMPAPQASAQSGVIHVPLAQPASENGQQGALDNAAQPGAAAQAETPAQSAAQPDVPAVQPQADGSADTQKPDLDFDDGDGLGVFARPAAHAVHTDTAAKAKEEKAAFTRDAHTVHAGLTAQFDAPTRKSSWQPAAQEGQPAAPQAAVPAESKKAKPAPQPKAKKPAASAQAKPASKKSKKSALDFDDGEATGIFAQKAEPSQPHRAPANRAAAVDAIMARAQQSPTLTGLDTWDEDYDDAPRRRRRRVPVWMVVCGSVLTLVLAVVITLAVLNSMYKVERFAADVRTAVAQQNYARLNELYYSDNGQTPTDAQWSAFCAAFETEQQQQSLENHLLKLANNQNATGEYPAVGLYHTTEFGLFKKYSFTVQPCTAAVTVNSMAQDVALWLNGEAQGEGKDDGVQVTFTGVFPGRYSFKVSGTVGAETVQNSGDGLLFMDAVTPVQVPLDLPTQDVRISGCVSPNAQITIGLKPQNAVIENGVAVITGVVPGMQINISYQDATQSTYKSSVTVVSGVTDYLFENYSVERALSYTADTAAQAQPRADIDLNGLNALVNIYYTSYIECVNNQNTVCLQYVTEKQRARLAEDITLSDISYTYAVSIVTVDYRFAVDANATMLCNAEIKYRQTKDDKTAEVVTYQTLQLKYIEGRWYVNNMKPINVDMFNTGVFADMP